MLDPRRGLRERLRMWNEPKALYAGLEQKSMRMMMMMVLFFPSQTLIDVHVEPRMCTGCATLW